MKKCLVIFVLFLVPSPFIYNQSVTFSGNPVAEIFADFHLNLNDTSRTSGFSLNRGYLGYNFKPDPHFSAAIIINAGTPDDLPPGAVPRRYAYIREASISYTNEKLVITFGITGTRLFDFQQKFWGKRYIANTYQSINGYGSVADLGLTIDYRISSVFKVDFTLMNGEGYSNLQLDNGLRSSVGLIITPASGFAFKIYGDLERVDDIWQPMFIGFAGFKNEKFTIGGEVSYKSNLDNTQGHHAWGFSGTAAVEVAKKTEIFSRYDFSSSVEVPGEDINWNYKNDHGFIVLGVQYTFNEYVKIALDFQGTNPVDESQLKSKEIILNALFKF